jgi:hypothetical protein
MRSGRPVCRLQCGEVFGESNKWARVRIGPLKIMENVLTQKLENAWNFFIIPGTPWKTYK